MSSHIPVNHPLRNVYRALAGAAGAYVLAFGIVGFVESRGGDFFDRADVFALGLRTNMAFSLLSIVVGAIVVVAAVVAGKFAHFVFMAGGGVFLAAGLVMLALMQTEANLLNYSVATCVVSFLIGLAMLLAGLYDKVGPPELAEAEERFRHRQGEDHTRHPWTTEGRYPHRPPESPDGGHRFA